MRHKRKFPAWQNWHLAAFIDIDEKVFWHEKKSEEQEKKQAEGKRRSNLNYHQSCSSSSQLRTAIA
jgi:hypothetical protein